MLKAIQIEIKENEIVLTRDIGGGTALKEVIPFGENIKIKFDTDKFKQCSRCKFFFKDLKKSFCPDCSCFLEDEIEFREESNKILKEKDKSVNKKERQEFHIGDIAYMIDEDFRMFESEVYSVERINGKFTYDTNDCEFTFEDIDKWVFKSELSRDMYLFNVVNNN